MMRIRSLEKGDLAHVSRVDEACFSAWHVSVFMILTFWRFLQLLCPRCNFSCVYCFCVIALSCGLCVGSISPHRYMFDSEALQTPSKTFNFPSLFPCYLRLGVCLSAETFPSNDEVCVYLLEYVCSRGPLRLILCPALLHPISLARHICQSHLDAASPPHPALPWLARLARCIGDLLVLCDMCEFKAAMECRTVCGI
jgi:hypothetical protein